MWLGLLFAISACFVWGAVFVIPEFLSDFSAVELVLGRYLIYGILSCVLFFRKGLSRLRIISKRTWGMAFIFALLSNIFYYLGVIGGIRFASAPLTVIVTGMAPIMIVLYGNWHVREVSFKSLIFPFSWMIFGLVLVHAAEIDWTFNTYSIHQYIFGLLGIIVALISWSLYAVHNARFLKRNPHILSTEWSTIIGICTFFWALTIGVFFAFVIHKGVDLGKFTHWSSHTIRFLLGSTILGVICSWIGSFLWNRACIFLPVSLMGPFLILESLFGLLFVYAFHFHFPSILEISGVVFMLGGILLSIHIFRKQKFVH